MIREAITPKDKVHWKFLRSQDITSTEVSALFGLSPYCTNFELWHRHHKGIIEDLESNDRMKWGSRLEATIAHGIGEDEGWDVRCMSEYIRIPDLKIGSSFDYAIGQDGILEIKNVDSLVFKEGWIIDGNNVEAPPHIELQVQHQLLVSGRKFAQIGAFVGGNRVVMIKREPNEQVFSAIKNKAAAFWESIFANKEPNPDFTKDADFICRMYNFAEPGKVINTEGNQDILRLATVYKEQSDLIKKAEQIKNAAKAQLLLSIGDAEKVIGDGFSISAGVVGPSRVEYDRSGYRNFRLNWKKEKANG